ncbi:hypothetical protein K502DRAFT_301020 [Neoconidiobolus thromboides FSU 785]|nr:hypothetical protein K502DRAFT_301020 [Neoconidiobolus thromboides FSU 785]
MTQNFLQNVLAQLGFSGYERINENVTPPTSKPPNPKGFFANERTFLSWLKFSLILGSLSIALLNYSDTPAGFYSASTFAILSVALMVYSYIVFRWRANKISNKEIGFYDERLGPIILIISVILGVSINFWLNFAASLL